MKVFIDTGAFLALQIKNDLNHLVAKQHFDILQKNRSIFFTNDYVLDETYTRLIYDIHLKAAENFQKSILFLLEKSQLTLLDIDPKVREKTWHELSKYSDHKFSFTDGTIITQFKEFNMDEIFTFDRQFRNINLQTNLVVNKKRL